MQYRDLNQAALKRLRFKKGDEKSMLFPSVGKSRNKMKAHIMLIISGLHRWLLKEFDSPVIFFPDFHIQMQCWNRSHQGHPNREQHSVFLIAYQYFSSCLYTISLR